MKLFFTTLLILLICGSVARSQTFRTADKKYSVIVKENKASEQLSLSIKLYKGEQFNPTLIKQWDNLSKRFYYGGANNNFKFFSFVTRDKLGNISKMVLSVYYYGNGYDEMYTEKLFDDIYYKSN